MSKISQVTRAAGSITIAVFLSRILGLIREQVLAYFFGAGRSMDAFVVAYRIPNLLRDLFAEGALGAAFTKVFSASLVKHPKEKSFQIASILISNILVVLLVVVLVLALFSPQIVSLIAPDFEKEPDKFWLTVNLTRIMMPFLLFISLSAVVAGMLNSLKVFFLPALSSAVFNLVCIVIGVSGYYLAREKGTPPIYAMGVGVLLGGAAQLAFQLPALFKKGFKFKFKVNFRLPEMKEIARLVFPVIFGLSIVQINIFINTFFATSCGEGAVSWYSYAFRIMYVPLGLFGVGLSQALLPELTKQITEGNFSQAKELYARCLVVSLSLSLPSAIGLYAFSEEVVKVLFERGAFGVRDTYFTSQLLKILSFSLPFYAFSKTTVPLFYSVSRTIIPALGSVLAVITNLAVILLTIKLLSIKAVALGTSVSLLVQAVFLLLVATYFLGSPFNKYTAKSVFFLILAGLFLYGAVFLSKEIFASPLMRLILGIPFAGGVYLVFLRLFAPSDTYLFFKRFFPFL